MKLHGLKASLESTTAELERPLTMGTSAETLCGSLPGVASQTQLAKGAGPFSLWKEGHFSHWNRHVWIQMYLPRLQCFCQKLPFMGSKHASLTMMELHTVLLLEMKFSFMAMGSRTGASLTVCLAELVAVGLMEPGVADRKLSDGASRESPPQKSGAQTRMDLMI